MNRTEEGAGPPPTEPPVAEPDGLQVLPVHGIAEVRPGDDLAALIAGAAPWLRDGDVLVVTSKIVSKAEGRLVEVPPDDGPERTAARAEALAAETARVVARRGQTTIVQTHHGFVMAAAGIDASNVDRNRLVLLPKDPDASARALRAGLRDRPGVDVAVIITDTMGRPWRNGLTDVAVGVAGLRPVRDHRGEVDPYGNELQVTEMAVVDELAGAGELVKGKCDQVPVAVVRGYLRPAPEGLPSAGDGPGAATLVRDGAADMFSLGTDEARALGRRDAALLDDPAVLPGGPVQPATLHRALAAVAAVVAPGTVFEPEPDVASGTDPRPDVAPGTELRPDVASGTEPRPDVAPGTESEPDVAAVAGAGGALRASSPATRGGGQRATLPAGATAMVRCRPPAEVGPAGWIRFGADLHRLRAALAAEGLCSTVVPDGTGALLAVSAG